MSDERPNITPPRRSRVWVLAACVLVVVGALWIRGMRHRDGRLASPGREHRAPASGDAFQLQAPRRDADGGWSLRWNRIADADAYQVRLIGKDRQEIGVLPSTPTPEARLLPEHLTVAGASDTVFVEVTALRFSDVIATSPLAPVKLH